jgi:hypothetical protein
MQDRIARRRLADVPVAARRTRRELGRAGERGPALDGGDGAVATEADWSIDRTEVGALEVVNGAAVGGDWVERQLDTEVLRAVERQIGIVLVIGRTSRCVRTCSRVSQFEQGDAALRKAAARVRLQRQRDQVRTVDEDRQRVRPARQLQQADPRPRQDLAR